MSAMGILSKLRFRQRASVTYGQPSDQIPWNLRTRECKNWRMVIASAKGQEGAPTRSATLSWVHLAIGVGMVSSARFAWLYSHAESDTPPPALALCLCELPFAFCLLPFFIGETSKRSVRSAGLVFGTALSFCPPLLLLEVGVNLETLGRGGYVAELARFLPVCFIAALCMLGVSWRCGKGDRNEFITWAKRGVLGFLLVSLLVLLASL